MFTQALFMERALAFLDQNKENPFFLYLPIALVHAELLVPQELGIDENTIVLFTSDNGQHNEGGADVGYFEGNGPLRGFKRDLYEGGIRVPMIAWSGGAFVKANAIGNAPRAMWDLFPTIAELAKAQSPAGLDGQSMTRLLRGERPRDSDRFFYWEYNDTWAAQGRLYSQAVRQGDWKLLRFRSARKDWVELYNLGQEISEYNNLTPRHPEVVARLTGLLDRARSPQP